MNHILDIGNTKIKLAIFEGDKMLFLRENLDEEALLKFLNQEKIQYLALTSVRSLEDNFIKKLQQITNVFILNSETLLPIKNLYKTPKTLGTDRVAAVVGARVLYPQNACLVIDAGTCITYDFIDIEKNYHGGNISPGLQMRFEAMNYFTSRLPLVENWRHKKTGLVGQSTKEAIQNGAVNGLIYEIEGTIRAYQQFFGNFEVLLCGGDRFFFETRIKEQIFVASNLTLIGLNEILRYNIEKK